MKKNVLIVEDNEDNSIIAEKILKYYGFDTAVSSHGKEALRYCETHLPDLILMDLSLPDIDGLELTRQLRKIPKFQNVPIIALTAHAMHEILEASQKAGLDDFLTKPFLPNDLINLVNKHLH
ncbi:MAG: response regulator [Candidatus Protochlamydia sp.]|nr:response regulator [Candidatus Protochlamydia sp.]